MNPVRQFALDLAASNASEAVQQQPWLIPISQSIHIVGVAVIVSSALVLGLHLLGIRRSSRTTSQLVATHVPWIHRALIALLCTGVLQTVAEPVRQLCTPQFWWKMGCLALVLVLLAWFRNAVRRDPARWDDPQSAPSIGATFGFVSIGLWIAIVVLGRLIGYTWVLQD